MELPAPYKEIVDQIIADNRDERIKQISDRVEVWDFSSITNMNQSKKISKKDFPDGNQMIVVETNRKTFIELFSQTYVQDLVVVDTRTDTFYRVASKHVKIIDKRM